MQNNKDLQPINKISLTQYEELSELELETVSGGKGGDKKNSSGSSGSSGGWTPDPRSWFKGSSGGTSVAFGLRG